jgi:pimeloyl-ACP methyl ester carboxylesterase
MKSDTFLVPGARLYYEARGSGPVLLTIPGGPADAGVFEQLAEHLSDRYTVVAYDPRGNSRSVPDDPSLDQSMDVHGDDAAALLAAFGDEPAYVLGSSGGAQISLNLAARHPERLRAVIAHEPPAMGLLPDADSLRAGMEEVYETYRREGVGPAMPRFQAAIGVRQPPSSDTPPPPEVRAMSGRIMGNLEYFLGHGIRPISFYVPDVETLRNGSVQVIVGVGETSEPGELAYRAGVALAERLGVEPVTFPGDHTGFISHPEPFAELLHATLRG